MKAGGGSKRALYSLGFWAGRVFEGRCSPSEQKGRVGHGGHAVDADPNGHQSPALGMGMASKSKGSKAAGEHPQGPHTKHEFEAVQGAVQG